MVNFFYLRIARQYGPNQETNFHTITQRIPIVDSNIEKHDDKVYSKSEGVDYPPLNRSKINLDKWKDQFMLEEVHSNQVQKFAYGYDLCGLR